MTKGLRLGESRKGADFENKTVAFHANDTIVFYTDGLIEGKNLKGDMYGKKQVRKILEGAIKKHPKEIIDSIMEDFTKYNGDKPLDDDVTLAITRIRPNV
jgi:serine phosphatase RsbU (regulator of sigma subunit)